MTRLHAAIGGLAFALLALPPAARAQGQPVAQPLGSTSTPDGRIKVDVLSLKRSEGDTLTLRVQIANSGTDTFTMTLGNIRLLDIPGRREYRPGVESPRCSVPAGGKDLCYAIFAAPPSGTKTMTVQFYEKLDLLSGIPVGD